MASPKGTSSAARAYARAVIELAASDAQATEIGAELSDLAGIIGRENTLRAFLLDPALTKANRWDVVRRSLQGRVNQLTFNLLGVLNEKGRMALLPEIGSTYQQLLDERLGRVRIDMTVAQGLDAGQMQMVQQRIGDALGKTAIIEQTVDDSIIGGIVLKVQDRIMDASVRAQLNAMREQLLAARVR